MSKKSPQWKFVNQKDSTQIIVVHDEWSATCIASLLKKVSSDWAFVEEEDAHTIEAATPTPEPEATKEEKGGRERRVLERHTKELRVILISGTKSFRTASENISLGGMRLRTSVPDSFIQGQCTVYVTHQDLKENIELVIQVIQDPQDAKRIRFINPDAVQLKRLEKWILENANKKSVA